MMQGKIFAAENTESSVCSLKCEDDLSKKHGNYTKIGNYLFSFLKLANSPKSRM